MSKHGPITAAPMSWAECAAAGMSKVEACRHRGMSRAAADYHAKQFGIQFTYKGNGSEFAAKQARTAASMERAGRFAHLNAKQIADYRSLRKAKYSSAEAMAVVEVRA